jgi:hypothetical protein
MNFRIAVVLLLVGIVSSLQQATGQALTGDTLSIKQGASIDQADANAGSLDGGLKFGQFAGPRKPNLPRIQTGEGIASKRTAGGNVRGLDFYTSKLPRLSITSQGLVGIGTGTEIPSHALDVRRLGDVEIGLRSNDTGGRLWTLQSSGITNGPFDGTFQIIDRTLGQSRLMIDAKGTVSVNVLKILGGADIAEPFQMSSPHLREGSVVIIDEDHAGQLTLSNKAYDRRVAGIISGANGIKAGITLESHNTIDGSQNVALTGRVYAMADASLSPIRPGDLLTTSETPGHCMKMTDVSRGHGAILGKAMTSLENGMGTVLVLVTLQ